MEKQKVFIPVSVEKEPDWKSNYYLGVSPNGRFNEFSSSEELKDIDISYWLKEQEGYFFTPEELKQYSDSKLSELEKWVDEQFKHADSLDKQDDTVTRYFSGKKDGLSLIKIKLQSLK